MSRVTTLPAPMTEPAPMRTPGQTMAPPPIHTSSPISTGRASSSPVRRCAALIGWVAAYTCTAGPKSTRAPMRTGATSSTTQLKLKKTLSPSVMLLP
jgi:hypothetical protein